MYFKFWFIFQTLIELQQRQNPALTIKYRPKQPCRAQHVKNVDSQEKASAPP